MPAEAKLDVDEVKSLLTYTARCVVLNCERSPSAGTCLASLNHSPMVQQISRKGCRRNFYKTDSSHLACVLKKIVGNDESIMLQASLPEYALNHLF